jgi:hypothetical protein
MPSTDLVATRLRPRCRPRPRRRMWVNVATVPPRGPESFALTVRCRTPGRPLTTWWLVPLAPEFPISTLLPRKNYFHPAGILPKTGHETAETGRFSVHAVLKIAPA